jgi:hypothetical protein
VSTAYGWWLQIWPNLAASVIWATPTFFLHHRLLRRHINRQHEQTQQHISDTLIGGSQ